LSMQLNSLTEISHTKEEFRGTWIATVHNLDWPKSNEPEKQRSELITLLDELKKTGINAVVFQVRNECDALYHSPYEPWSYWLTKEQGTPPDPFYDPLEFAIEEAHKRGMELHAWFNPYRAVNSVGSHPLHPNHVSQWSPNWLLDFGTIKLLDPGLPDVREYVTSVVLDVVERYDVDGIHFDDYFYPYPNSNTGFPGITNEDDNTYANYSRGFTDRGDWRRDNINLLIEMVYNGIQSKKPFVKFGISPFGIWKNGTPPGIVGLDAYNRIYCDAVAWLDKQIVDYLTPQLYWPFGGGQDYGKLLPWWATQTNGRHLISGNGAYRIDNWSNNEMPNQIRLNRQTNNVKGNIFYRATNVLANLNGFTDSLKTNLYRYPAIAPVMPWKETVPPNKPQNATYEQITELTSEKLVWDIPATASDGDSAFKYVVYRFENSEIGQEDIDDARNILGIVGTKSFSLQIPPDNTSQFYYAIASLDRNSNESILSNIISIEPPVTPVLTYPTNYEQNQPPEITLSWFTQSNAISYIVQISPDSTFNPLFMLEESSVTDTFKTIATLDGMEKYFWRVKAGNAGGHSTFSEVYRFETGFPASPILSLPANESIDVPTIPVLSWDETAGATSYCLQVSKLMSFNQTSIILDTCEIADTTFSGFSLDPNSLYYWRLSASNSIGVSKWSEVYRFQTGEITGIAENSLQPTEFRLLQSYPNPFNASVTIPFYLPRQSRVVLKIYDALGREVAFILDKTLMQGFHNYTFNANDLASGNYYSRLFVDDRVLVGKMLLLK